MAKAGETITGLTGLPEAATSAAFSVAIGAACALLAPPALDKLNTVLVGGVVASFVVSLCKHSGVQQQFACSWMGST